MKKLYFVFLLILFLITSSSGLSLASCANSYKDLYIAVPNIECIQTDVPRTNSIYVKSNTQSFHKKDNSQDYPSYISDVNRFVDICYPKFCSNIENFYDYTKLERICSSYNPRAP